MGKIDQLISSYITDEKSPGIAAAVIKEGRCIYQQYSGYGNIENNIKINSSTNFYLASVSKAFTGASIALLYERGQIDINDRLSDYFSDLPDYYRDIKIINLVNHTSGLRDYFGYFLEQSRDLGIINNDVLDFMMADNILEFETGTQFNYSNTGYVLLSMIVEKVSGQPFEQFLSNNIFEPLGMKSTYFYSEKRPIVPNRAYGYKEEEGQYYCNDYGLLTKGDGGIYSSIEDLVLWQRAFRGEGLFSDKTLELMLSTEKIDEDTPVNYGFGWNIRIRDNKKIVFHDGNAYGFRTFIGTIPGDDFSVIILTNCYKDMWKEIYKRASYIMLEIKEDFLR